MRARGTSRWIVEARRPPCTVDGIDESGDALDRDATQLRHESNWAGNSWLRQRRIVSLAGDFGCKCIVAWSALRRALLTRWGNRELGFWRGGTAGEFILPRRGHRGGLTSLLCGSGGVCSHGLR